MRNLQMLGLAFVALLMLAVVGCGDDENTTAPAQTFPLGYTQGNIYVSPNTRMPRLEIHGNGAVTPNLDSIKVGDSLVNRQDWSMYSDGMFSDAYWAIPFVEDGDTSTLMYDPGDTAVIKVWGEGRFSSCRVKLLNPEEAILNITSPLSMADTIAFGGSDTVYWNKVDQADYYAVMVPWAHYSGNWLFGFYYATDTSFIITGNMMPDSVWRCDVVVSPFNGPDPRTDRSNWTGNLLDGVVYSSGGYRYVSIIINAPAPLTPIPRISADQPIWNADEIVANVYKKYGK
ncbi:hypothetical protein C3F09_04780 [candidate division GN15 bacterium]|uniref:Uncharacterized protein n=1 Tax=candidate division GN15 bacterium TaxID=2072418 RepID=A0A855X8H4_9BACT|nr:MAG: hypothetical protein C3F09_04780 [candidate division GN15 bacterium]